MLERILTGAAGAGGTSGTARTRAPASAGTRCTRRSLASGVGHPLGDLHRRLLA